MAENEKRDASDPVVAWLERIRDFEGATDEAREMSQRAIDRLTAPAPASTSGAKVDRIVEAAAAETEAGRAARRQP